MTIIKYISGQNNTTFSWIHIQVFLHTGLWNGSLLAYCSYQELYYTIMTHLQFLIHARVQHLRLNSCCLLTEPWPMYLKSYNKQHSFTCVVQWTQSKAHFFIDDQAKPSEKESKRKMFIQIKSIWYYNVYIHKLKLSIHYSD